MEVGKEHRVDCELEKDGAYEYYYAYWLFSFRASGVTLVARSYDDRPQEAHFLRREAVGATELLTDGDLAGPLFAAACGHLRQIEGKSEIAVLKRGGYENLNTAETP